MNARNIITGTLLGTLVLSTVLSCVDDNDDLYSKNGTVFINYNGPNAYEVPENGGEGEDNSWSGLQDAMGYEVPALRQGSDYYFVSHHARLSNDAATTGLNYCLEWDATAFHSRWVAFVFDSSNNASRISRTNAWGTDPLLPPSVSLGTDAYSGSGFTRGHLCASADRLNSTEANQQTFYMSNMSPQLYDYNGGYWAVLEAIVQSWGRSSTYKKVYVCKGGTIRDEQLLGNPGYFNTYTLTGSTARVKIPRYNFMAILAETAGGSFQAIGFLMEHKDYKDGMGNNYSSSNRAPSSLMKQHAMSVDELEKFTGINFFCNIDDGIELPVESNYNESAWNW